MGLSQAAAPSAAEGEAGMLSLYSSMARAKRSEAVLLSSSGLEALLGADEGAPRGAPSAWTRLARFRALLRERGQTAPRCEAPGSRKSALSGCALIPLGRSLWACSRCGAAHLCDANCTLATDAGEGELPVCPISGRCLDLMVGEEGGEGAPGGADDWNADEAAGGGGRLGRAFLAGYNANSREMFQQFGVSLR